MVEGHSVHRIASRFRSKLVGRKFHASSPNGRFEAGAAAIDGRVLSRMEAVGKNLFAFFSSNVNDTNGAEEEDAIVVHVHFGMSGAWAVYNSQLEDEPEVKPTTRLRLEETSSNGNNKFITHLSAMTVNHGNRTLYTSKKAALGQDPLRPDANPTLLYEKIIKSKKSIGQLIMDQSFFAGPGNIYRAEILFLAGVYPTTSGMSIDRTSFDKIWNVSVKLLRRGYDTGSILTVDAELDPTLAAKGERRYIYNKSKCARCGGKVASWDMSGRTCYACESGSCQPKMIEMETSSVSAAAATGNDNEVVSKKGARKKKTASGKKKGEGQTQPKQHVPFISHCAPMTLQQRLETGGAEQLTIAEIRTVMEQKIGTSDADDIMPPKSARKAVHVEALNNLLEQWQRKPAATPVKMEKVAATPSKPLPPPKISPEDAAREKAASGENRAVEHVAELSREQAVKAISSAVTPSPVAAKGKRKSPRSSGGSSRGVGSSHDGDDAGEVDVSDGGKKRRTSSRRRLKYDH